MLFRSLGFATNVLSDDFDKWCVEHFGANYRPWLLATLVAGTLIALYFTTDIGKNLFSNSNASDRPLYLSPKETQRTTPPSANTSSKNATTSACIKNWPETNSSTST